MITPSQATFRWLAEVWATTIMTTLPEPESHLLDHNCPYSPHTTVLVAHSSDDKIGCGVIESTAGEIVQLAKYPNNTVKNVSGTLLVTQTTNGPESEILCGSWDCRVAVARRRPKKIGTKEQLDLLREIILMSLDLTKCGNMYFECIHTRNKTFFFPKSRILWLLNYLIWTNVEEITVVSDAL